MKCYTEKQYKRRKIKKRIIRWSVFIAIIVGIVCYFNFYVNPIILTTNTATIKAKTVEVVNLSISNVLSNNSSDDLIKITYDSDGNVSSIVANTVLANKLNTMIVDNCQTNLSDMTMLNFSVPLGTFSGMPFLNGLGPKITIKMTPVGSISTKFNSVFTSQGINQTCHQIYLNITANISVLLPGVDKTVKVTTQYLISESIIVGKVPQVYFGSNNTLNSQLNLVP